MQNKHHHLEVIYIYFFLDYFNRKYIFITKKKLFLARRSTIVDQGAPWGTIEIERSMTSLKFYHDLNCDMEQINYAFGPCWEPVIAQCNLSK